MRRKPFGKLLPSAHAVDREFRVIAALGKQGFPVAKAYALCTDDSRDRRRLLHHVDGRGPGVLGSDAAEPDAGQPAQDLHQQDRDAGQTPRLRSRENRARRFRQARQLFRAPGRSLDQAIPRVRNPAHSGIRETRRVAAENRAGAGARLDRPRRLPPRQHDFPCDGTARAGGAGLGTVDARRSHGRLHLSVDAVDHAGSRQCRSQGAQHSEPGRGRADLLQRHRQRRARPELVFCLQPVPPGRHHAGHRRARSRRHRGQRQGAGVRRRAPCRCRRLRGNTRRRPARPNRLWRSLRISAAACSWRCPWRRSPRTTPSPRWCRPR